jgi:hypothetical protein
LGDWVREMTADPFKRKIPVQYLGESGITRTCILAINAVVNSGILPKKATVVTYVSDKTTNRQQEKHLFIFWDWQSMPIVVIHSGFASGYSGEGPRGFDLAICIIREKGIPIESVDVKETMFKAIDEGKIIFTDDPIWKDIKAESETHDYFIVPTGYEEALERGQLWRHQYLQGYKLPDSLSIAISNIDWFSDDIGRKLRLADNKTKSDIKEDWQNTGLLIRDAWIELAQRLCDEGYIRTPEIPKDKVIDKLKKLELDEEVISLAKASLDLSLKVQHDRKVTRELAIACVASAVFTMQPMILKYIKTWTFK